MKNACTVFSYSCVTTNCTGNLTLHELADLLDEQKIGQQRAVLAAVDRQLGGSDEHKVFSGKIKFKIWGSLIFKATNLQKLFEYYSVRKTTVF